MATFTVRPVSSTLPTTLDLSLFNNPATCYTVHRPAPGLLSITVRDNAALNLADLISNSYDHLVAGKPASFPLNANNEVTYPRWLRHCSGTISRTLRPSPTFGTPLSIPTT